MEPGQPTVNPPALLAPESVLGIVEKELEARGLVYDKTKGLWPTYYGLQEIWGGELVSHWSVAFATPARAVPFRDKIVEVDEKMYFALVDDSSGKFLYIHHATGYSE